MNQRPTLPKPVGSESLANEDDFRLGDILVRPSLREIRAGETLETLEPRVMQVLVVLAAARGAVVSRDELILKCWGGRIVGEAAINRCIWKLRELGEKNGGAAFRIETIPRVGYRLLSAQTDEGQAQPQWPDVARPQTDAPARMAELQVPPPAARFESRKFWLLAILAAGIVAATVALVPIVRPAGQLHGFPQQPTPHVPTVAVLPFTPLYADAHAQSYVDEISSDVANTLGQTDVNVIAPALSFQFRGDAKARAARALHADVLVDGDVRRNVDAFNVSVRVVDVASGLILLAKDIQRPASQAADLPDQVATFIAGALGYDAAIRTLNSDRRWSPRVRTGILRALAQCPYRSDPFCAYEVGRELVSVAPDNAIAQSILAIETTNVLDRLPGSEKPAAIATARKAAGTAIRLDPRSGDPYIALSELARDTATSEAYLRKGLAVDPDSLGLAGYLSALLCSTGRNNEALDVVQRVAERFKFKDYGSTNQINAMLALGDTANAVEIAKRGRRLWPDTWLFALFLFDAAAFQGDPAQAEAMLSDPVTGPILQPPGVALTFVHMVRALRTHREEDIDTVSRDCAHFDAEHWWRTRPCVVVLATFGRINEAFRLPVAEYPQYLLFWQQTAPLRADPRFLALTKKLGLFAYWKATHSRPDFCATEHVPVCQALVR